MQDFCPYCGANLSGSERYCPECGAQLDAPVLSQEYEPLSNYRYLAYFAVGFLATFILTYVLGLYFLFLFIPIFFLGGRQSRFTLFAVGAMLGTVAGYAVQFLL